MVREKELEIAKQLLVGETDPAKINLIVSLIQDAIAEELPKKSEGVEIREARKPIPIKEDDPVIDIDPADYAPDHGTVPKDATKIQILAELEKQDGLTAQELADRIHCKLKTIQNQFADLEGRGCIEIRREIGANSHQVIFLGKYKFKRQKRGFYAQQILAILTDKPMLTKDIAIAIHATTSVVAYAMKKLYEAKKVIREGTYQNYSYKLSTIDYRNKVKDAKPKKRNTINSPDIVDDGTYQFPRVNLDNSQMIETDFLGNRKQE